MRVTDLEDHGDISELRFDITHNLAFCASGEAVSTLAQHLHGAVGEVSAGRMIEASNGASERMTFEHGHHITCVAESPELTTTPVAAQAHAHAPYVLRPPL